jgi:hypothetical protein
VCAEALEMLHVYAEVAAVGEPVDERYPGIAAHLRICGPCGDDLTGSWPRWPARLPDGLRHL